VRQIVLDTETTGLEADLGHRIIEIGCVELDGRALAPKHFHHYINPERESDARALEVHQITSAFLADKPLFAAIATPFLDFVRGAELLIHNAPFDVAFINAELARLNLGRIEEHCKITDTLVLAKALYPGQRNGLDALCKRLGVDNSSRTAHGALLDASLLADVYLAMTRGQNALEFGASGSYASDDELSDHLVQVSLLRSYASAGEIEAHIARLQQLDKASKGQCLWLKLEAALAA
jgi:DNA polymerase III subunit epsilon